MSLTIELSPRQEQVLHRVAEQKGISIAELVALTINERFPDDENARSLALIEEWIATAPQSAEEQEEAERDLCSFQDALNQSRQEAGARILFPERLNGH